MIRTAEADAVDKLAGISAARDVDLDLLRMVLRLLVMRALALELSPARGEDGKGVRSGKTGQHEDEATEEVREVRRLRRYNIHKILSDRSAYVRLRPCLEDNSSTIKTTDSCTHI